MHGACTAHAQANTGMTSQLQLAGMPSGIVLGMAAEVAVEVEAICVREDGEKLPLIVRPRHGNDSLAFLQSWIARNKGWLDQKLLDNGAVLFRGFQVKEGLDFQRTVQCYNPELSDEYRGTSPRKLIPGTQFVFSASELPAFYPIPQHLEMSFLPAPPRKIFFCCLEAPTSPGGETCLCDFGKVYQQLDPSVRNAFEEKGVMHVRNYKGQKTLLVDPTMLKGWQDVFQTDDRAVVEQELRRTGQEFSWGSGDSLRIVGREAAVETHPVTKDKIWFNHSGVFHWSMIPSEMYRVYKRLGGWRYLALSWLGWFLKVFFLNCLGPSWLGFHTYFGDGSTIPESHLEHVRDVVWQNMVFNRWQQGDIVMLDNFRISHGRQPYSGSRKIVVAWSKPQLKPSRLGT